MQADSSDYEEGCLDGDKQAQIDFRAHIQKEVTTAIVSLVSQYNLLSTRDSGKGAELEAVKSYLGTLVEEVNKDLYSLGVQINLIIDPLSLDEISANGSYDPSCEMAAPVKLRTQNELTTLRDKLNGAVGVHFYIYSCVYLKPEYDLVSVAHNNTCGRVMGVMWNGSEVTKVLLKSLIIEALTGVAGTYQTGGGRLTSAAKSALCRYANTCIGRSQSQLGVLLDHRARLEYTQKDDHSDARLIEAY